MSKLTETKTWGMCYYIYILKAGKDKNTNDRKKLKPKRQKHKKTTTTTKGSILTCQGSFTIL